MRASQQSHLNYPVAHPYAVKKLHGLVRMGHNQYSLTTSCWKTALTTGSISGPATALVFIINH